MRTARCAAVCTAVSLAVAGLAAPVAVAQDSPPSTPIPGPADPEQPPASQPTPAPGPVVGDAGTLIGALRILPGTVPTDTIVDDPEFEEQLPKQSVAEFGLGRAIAQVNSTAFFAHERSIAESSPFGVSLFGKTPEAPGSGALAQNALPDRPEPKTSGLEPPETPGDRLLNLAGPSGRVHARWDEQRGPCVSPLSDAQTSLGGAAAVNALPEGEGENGPQGEELLGGLLDGQETSPDGAGSLANLPGNSTARSTVELVDAGPQPGKALRSTSTLQLSSMRVFPGTPEELQVDVVAGPRLTATSTGDPETSTVEYENPVLRVLRGGEEIGRLDADNPTLDLPIGGNQDDGPPPLNLGVVRMSMGELRQDVVDGETRAQASLFDLDVLRGEPIGLDGSLARLTFGEQAVRAGAPQGGVRCDDPAPTTGGDAGAAPAEPAGADPADTQPAGYPGAAGPLAVTSAYHTVPLFWAGAGLLLTGSILVAALPRHRRQH
ncbi:hypothetical protein IQ251_06830 [Saccharopolyspora sp. HNM0983]|uniref:Uncharacterized protein n=1 Tax=Saccharopolyspora montiporae TaxID=2781240 RepID=A0A929B8I5_9PSEU|nr:hypothetical protein [Saccharopolyspora sp. HNM0983]MBE9374160.1 hypothetical protein [Saccharopolyspora sp. HNM0983]